MRKLFTILPYLLILSIILAACDDSMGESDSRLSQVEALIEPTNDKIFALEPSVSAAAYFEWDFTQAINSGTSVYQIAFDKLDGDFSKPIYVLGSDNNGFNNSVTISHKKLNKIAGMMGIGASGTGTFKWTVLSLKGTQSMKAKQENKITVTRLAGFAELPIDVYVTGNASEGGTDTSKAHKMKAVAGGEFEVYTKLKANSEFYFTDGTSSESRKFYTSKNVIKENGISDVSIEGVYKITLDFNTGASTYTLVNGIAFYFSPDGKALFELPYVGNGIFKTNATVTFKQEGWGRDERYKFMMQVIEDAGKGAGKTLEWGTLNPTDSRPNPTSPESYYYLKLFTDVTRWENKWKMSGDFDNVPAVYTIYLQADRPYTHSITK
ncbi:MAG: SusE domain-containing protein [Candidatus Saccharimonadaceae bacterium]